MFASSRGIVPAVKVLLEKGANVANRVNFEFDKNRDGSTALIIAAQNNLLDIVRLMIDHGANVNARTK